MAGKMERTPQRWEARWLTVKEAAEYTRTDEEWILMHIRSGALRYVPTARRTVDNAKGPRRRIVDRLKLDALMERLEVMEPQPAVRDQADAVADARTKPKAAYPPGMSARERLDRGL